MFGIGAGEMLVIAIVLVLVVGPERMPGMMRQVGQGVRQLRRKSQELRDAVGIDQLLYDDPVLKPPAALPVPATEPPGPAEPAASDGASPPDDATAEKPPRDV